MKKILFIALSLISLNVFAQNAGVSLQFKEFTDTTSANSYQSGVLSNTSGCIIRIADTLYMRSDDLSIWNKIIPPSGGSGTPSLTQYRLAVGDASNLLSTNAAITGNRALASDANGIPIAATTTATELGYVNGVTSSIQTQLNAKGTFTLPSLTSGSVLFSNGTTITQDNSNLFWDNTNKRLGIGTASPSYQMHLRHSGTGYIYPLYIENNGDPGNGATRIYVGNTVSSFLLQAYGSTAPGSLASAGSIASLTGSKLLLGAGTSMSVQIYSNLSYISPQFVLDASSNFNFNSGKVYFDNGGSVGIGTASPGASALLDMTSTTKGFLPPRMTTAQRNAISSPATGLQVYDTDLKQPQYNDGVTWKAQVGMTFGTAAPSITPAAIGNFFLDTTNKKLYVSTGTSSSADWEILN